MTGIRSWTVEVMAFGVDVKIEQVLTQFPLGSFQRSQIPANDKHLPVTDFKTIWLLGLPDLSATRKIHLLGSSICEASTRRGTLASSPRFPILR